MVGYRLILITALAFPCSAAADSRGANAPAAQAKIVYIDVNNAFFTIDKGRMDGVRADKAFTIVRLDDVELKLLGSADFEKFMGQNSMTKLLLRTGDLRELRLGDLVLYSRR